MKRLLLFFLLIMVLPAFGIAGTAYYVDPEAPFGGNGSFSTPWNNINQINAKTFSTGDSVYFKVNTTLKPNALMSIRWNGTAANRVTIGAYYGNGLFGLRAGDRRPIFDLETTNFSDGAKPAGDIFTGDYDGFITAGDGRSYITVRDLEFKNMWNGALRFRGVRGGPFGYHNHIRNCRFISMGRQSIVLAMQHHAIADSNYVNGSNLRKVLDAKGSYNEAGAAIEVSAGNRLGHSVYNQITNNTLHRTGESIGIYMGAQSATVRNNVVYDYRRNGIYVSNSEKVTVEENLVYQPGTNTLWRSALEFQSEGHIATHAKLHGYHTVRNNYIASAALGIVVVTDSTEYPRHIQIHGNRIVDCNINIQFRKNDSNWHDNYIYGNYSFIYTSGFKHTNSMFPLGFIWGVKAVRGTDYNLTSTGMKQPNFFDTEIATVTGNAANNATFGKVSLKTKRNWRFLKPGEVTREWFEFTNEIQDQLPPPKVQNVEAVLKPK